MVRLNSGSVSWQLAVRRLQLSSGSAARMVNGIAVAVAGAIALQMLFAGVQGDYTKAVPNDLSRAQMEASVAGTTPLAEVGRRLTGTKGVRDAWAISTTSVGNRAKTPDDELEATVGSCAELREVARLTSCRDGDVFRIAGGEYDDQTRRVAKEGNTVYLNPMYDASPTTPTAWKVPAGVKTATHRKDPSGYARDGLLFTSGHCRHRRRRG